MTTKNETERLRLKVFEPWAGGEGLNLLHFAEDAEYAWIETEGAWRAFLRGVREGRRLEKKR